MAEPSVAQRGQRSLESAELKSFMERAGMEAVAANRLSKRVLCIVDIRTRFLLPEHLEVPPPNPLDISIPKRQWECMAKDWRDIRREVYEKHLLDSSASRDDSEVGGALVQLGQPGQLGQPSQTSQLVQPGQLGQPGQSGQQSARADLELIQSPGMLEADLDNLSLVCSGHPEGPASVAEDSGLVQRK